MVIPAMIEWGQGKAETLNLTPYFAARDFDHVCTVAGYQALGLIKEELPGVSVYRGRVGFEVPENRHAVIGVVGNTAHIAYLRDSSLSLRNLGLRCVPSTLIYLRRDLAKSGARPAALLEP